MDQIVKYIINSHGHRDVCINGYLYRNPTGGKPRKDGSFYYRCKKKDCSLTVRVYEDKIVKASPYNLKHPHAPEDPGKIEVRKGTEHDH